MKNRRKDMVMKKLWITRAELESLNESIKILNGEASSRENGYAMSKISEIIQNASNRGDL